MRACVRAAWTMIVAMLVTAAVVSSGGLAGAASSSVVVTLDVASSLSFTQSCNVATATSLGVVQPDIPATTATGSGACQLGWSSSNDSSRLRMVMSDRTAPAMAASTTAWNRGKSGWSMALTIDAYDSNRIFVAGEDGVIRRTDNGGSTWDEANPGTPEWLFDIEALPGNPDRVVTVGGDGFVASSSNAISSLPGPATWTDRSAALDAAGWPTHGDIQAMAFVSSNTWLVGGLNGWIGRTTDGGISWTTYQIAGAVGSISDIERVSATEYVAVTEWGRFLRTITSGVNAAAWTVHTPANGDYQNLSDLAVGDATHIYASSRVGSIFRWDGSTFTGTATQPSRFTSRLTAAATSPTTPATLWVAGDHGITWTSTDSGGTWSRQQSASAASMYAGDALDGSTAFFVGSNGDITKTGDGGTTWTKLYSDPSFAPMLGIDHDPVDGRIAVAVGGDGDMYRTTDKGGSWSTVASGTSEHLYDIDFGSSAVAWAVGEAGTIIYSDDGGATWGSQSSPSTDALRDVEAVDELHAWAVGDNGTVLATTNGGTSWTAQNSTISNDLVSIAASDVDTAVLLGGDSHLERTTDGGSTWSDATSAPNERWTAVTSTDVDTFVAVGMFGDFFRSTDAGDTWGWVSSSWADGVDLDSAGRALTYLTMHGGVARSNDGGDTWTATGRPMSRASAAITTVDGNSQYATKSTGSLWNVDEATLAAQQISDYGGGSNFGSGSATSTFGVCLQSLAGATVDAPWVVDGGTCTATDADPWRAVPSNVSNVASAILGTTGTATFVFGARTRSDQTPGTYSAGVTFEAIAPAA